MAACAWATQCDGAFLSEGSEGGEAGGARDRRRREGGGCAGQAGGAAEGREPEIVRKCADRYGRTVAALYVEGRTWVRSSYVKVTPSRGPS